MRKRFTRALYAVSAVAVAAGSLSLGIGAASAATHTKKDTAACGNLCISLFSAQLGSFETQNAYIAGDTGVGGKVGTKINLHLFGNYRPNGDFSPTNVGYVFQFCGFLASDFFSPTSYICTHYPFFDVFEVAWSPYGNQSNLCVGVAKAGVIGENVTLQKCGLTAKTVWVADRNHATNGQDCRDAVQPWHLPVGPGVDPHVNYCPWINGADRRFSQPLVLTLDTGTQKPQEQLKLQNESLVAGQVRTNQLFAFYNG